MATPRNRQYQTRGKGNVDLGSILLGVLGGAGTGEVEEIPGYQPQGPTQEGGILPAEPGKFQVKDKMRDYTGRGQEAANQANIRSKLAEQERLGEIKSRQTLGPIEAENAKLREEAITKPLVDRAKLIAGVQNDAELQRLLKTNPEHLAQARKIAAVNVLAAKGIIPTEENINTFNNSLTETQIGSELETEREKALRANLGQATARKGLDIEEATRPTDIKAAVEQSQLGLETAKGNREVLPYSIRAKKLEPDRVEGDILRNRLFPTQGKEGGTEYYDIKYPTVPVFGHTKSPLEQVMDTQIKAKYPGAFNVPSGNPANYPAAFTGATNNAAVNPFDADQYETVIIDGQAVRRKKKQVLP